MQEAAEIIRSVRQKFPAPEADEQSEVFPLDVGRIGTARRFRDSGMGGPKGARVAGQLGDAGKQGLIRGARKQRREQRIFLRPRGIDLVEISGPIGPFVIGANHRSVRVAHPVISRALQKSA